MIENTSRRAGRLDHLHPNYFMENLTGITPIKGGSSRCTRRPAGGGGLEGRGAWRGGATDCRRSTAARTIG